MARRSHLIFQHLTVVVFPGMTLTLAIFLLGAQAKTKFTWMAADRYDEIIAHMDSVNAKNCRAKSKEQLTLRKDVVSQLPYFNTLLSKTWYRNRSSLVHIHNMALNRAFFYSYILQRMNTSSNFAKQPGWVYFYYSATADINANPKVLNGSSLFFDNHCHYPNWYTTVPFNKTLPLFGPKLYRWDDTSDQDNLLREPTRQVVQGVDLGAGHSNYTDRRFKMNPWYSNWMPDLIGNMDSLTKFTYYVGIRHSNVTGQFERDSFEDFHFFGPASPSASESDPRRLPVEFTAPYFDCGGANKWVVSSISPVIDFMPRYSNYTHLRRQRVVAVAVMDIHLMEVDFNPCGLSAGNPGPSYLSGVNRCKKMTLCKHKAGYGLRRGSYTCACVPGTRYPWYLEMPFDGEDIERATDYEYENSFSCTKVQMGQVLPVIDNLPGSSIEGSDASFGSGGVGAANEQRKQRSADDRTENYANIGSAYRRDSDFQDRNESYTLNKDLQGYIAHEPTVQDIVTLADTIRALKKQNILQTMLPQDVTDDFFTSRDDHKDRNSVGFHIEMFYQKDVNGHKQLSQKLLRPSNNITLTLQAIKDSVTQIRSRHIQRFESSRSKPQVKCRRKRASVYDDQAIDRMLRLLRQKSSVTPDNCHSLPNHRLYLPGDVAYGANSQFESEGRTALRLAHFLSMYLQNVMPDENFGNLRGGGILHIDQMFAEVLANVMGNYKIYSSGIFFDRYTFQDQDRSFRELFGPEAFRYKGSFYAVNTAGYSKQYIEQDWFSMAKSRFSTNTMGTKVYKLRAYLRSDSNGSSTAKHEHFPVTYKAATYELGFWTRPYFRCDGYVNAWVLKYVVPFFGVSRRKLEFRGVTTVEVPLNLLEINQCPMSFNVPNAFKNTARCDYFSTKCVPLAGFPFMRGAYRCNCRLGFEYWHSDGKFWIEGSLLELEYEKKKAGLFSRFDLLNCRASVASGRVELQNIYFLACLLLIWVLHPKL
ncbi:hypothetical protein Bpfe_009740 [Biomphalaria pfeifferi]|uniref:GPR158/179 extracellular domain-containing protein n=1 Tax=Biomphalaria pfeifferi TaxID=112525 RepID=A0AAD8BUH0_BIOPF|nr:hypothetical protein Bpfe_009740 [Biomphalaria pfeifferi]